MHQFIFPPIGHEVSLFFTSSFVFVISCLFIIRHPNRSEVRRVFKVQQKNHKKSLGDQLIQPPHLTDQKIKVTEVKQVAHGQKTRSWQVCHSVGQRGASSRGQYEERVCGIVDLGLRIRDSGVSKVRETQL